MEEKDKILELTEEKIFREGFYKTTMAEVAESLSMSKKTIYKYYPSKNELVEAIMRRFMQNHMAADITPILDSNANAVEKLGGLILVLSKNLPKLSEKFLNDLRKHLPLLWNEVEEFRTGIINKNISKIIEQGKKEGLIYDYPTEIIITIILSSIRGVITPQFIFDNNFSMKQAIQTTFKILMGGILTKNGMEIFYKSISENLQ